MLTLRFSLLLLILASATAPVRAAVGWNSDWNSAVSTAQSCHMPLVVLFEHEGCPDCERMDRSLAASASHKALELAVKVRLEFTANPDVVARFGVSLTPTFLVLSPDSGSLTEVYREVGSMSVSRIVQVGKSVDSLAARLAPLRKPQTVSEPAEKKAEVAKTQEKPAAKKKTSSSRKRTATRRRTASQQQSPAPQRSYYVDQYGRAVYYQQAQPQPQQEQPRRRLWPFR